MKEGGRFNGPKAVQLCSKFKEIVQHPLAGCQKLAGTEYVKRDDSALKVIAQWGAGKGILPAGTK